MNFSRPGDFENSVVEDIYDYDFGEMFTNSKFVVPVESDPICPH